jgi:hypothetical protein
MPGSGKRPASAARVASISPTVNAGTSTSATMPPTTGTIATSDSAAMNMKNRPVSATGRRKKVRMPARTHWAPAAGTTLSFMA